MLKHNHSHKYIYTWNRCNAFRRIIWRKPVFNEWNTHINKDSPEIETPLNESWPNTRNLAYKSNLSFFLQTRAISVFAFDLLANFLGNKQSLKKKKQKASVLTDKHRLTMFAGAIMASVSLAKNYPSDRLRLCFISPDAHVSYYRRLNDVAPC